MEHVETPRHVKKPGEWLRVENQAELEAALKDGWVLRLPPAKGVKGVKAQEPMVEAPERPEPEDSRDEEGTASEPDAQKGAEPVKKKRGRPKKGG